MERNKMPEAESIELIKCKYCENHTACTKCYYSKTTHAKKEKSENKKFWEDPRA